MSRFPAIKEANKMMLICTFVGRRFSHDVAKLNLRSVTRHASQREKIKN